MIKYETYKKRWYDDHRFQIYTIPCMISISSATMTTGTEMINPWIIGRTPDFFMSLKEVFRPMAAKAQTIKNLLADLVIDTTFSGTVKTLAKTGSFSTTSYVVDVNLDGVFNSKDTIASKNLYCITSPVSFSCGNLVPALLKESGKVTMLGDTSGGDSDSEGGFRMIK